LLRYEYSFFIMQCHYANLFRVFNGSGRLSP